MSNLTTEIVGYECKNVVHIRRPNSDLKDLHLIKENIHFKDGTTKPNVRLKADFKRPFWVTPNSKRYHKQKKEYEHTDNLIKHECTQSDIRNEVAKVLDKRWSSDTLRQLQNSPYLYGADVESSAFIKYEYRKRWPNLFSASSNCAFDTETDMINGTEEIIIVSACFKGKAMLGTTKAFVEGFSSPEAAFKEAHQKYLKDDMPYEDIHFFVKETNIEILIDVFAWIHANKPDFLTAWNMDFDIKKIISCCKKHNYSLEDLFSDPIVPKEYRYFEFREGTTHKTTSSGVFKPKPPQDQWHFVIAPASFCMLDPMCLYRQIRITGALEKGYNLDAMLDRHINRTKLKFEKANGLAKAKWHCVMQAQYHMEYLCYALFDSKGMLLLDEKLMDVMYTVQPSTGLSSYARFNSQPKKIQDEYFFFCLSEKNLVLATLPTDVAEDETVEDMLEDLKALERKKQGFEEEEADSTDENEDSDPITDGLMGQSGTLGLKGWVLTLDPQNSVLGLCIAADDATLHTNFRKFVYDADSAGAYPTVIDVANVSKTTTTKELIAIEGIPKEIFRFQNLNFLLGQTNSLEYCQVMHKLPRAYDLLVQFQKEI